MKTRAFSSPLPSPPRSSALPPKHARHPHRPLQAAGADRRRRHGRRLHGRAAAAGPPTVALKIIKPGMDTQAGDRPLRGRAPGPGPDGPSEHRQGARRRARPTSGRPYFVMELVRGIPITEYCDQNKLTDSRAAGAVRPGLPGRAARPSEGDHPPRPQAVERPGHGARRHGRCPR